MSRNYKKLALHNAPCNDIYFQFQDCLLDHPYAKFVGKCTIYGKELEKCIKENREIMREKNRQLALEKLEKTKEAMKQKANVQH